MKMCFSPLRNNAFSSLSSGTHTDDLAMMLWMSTPESSKRAKCVFKAKQNYLSFTVWARKNTESTELNIPSCRLAATRSEWGRNIAALCAKNCFWQFFIRLDSFQFKFLPRMETSLIPKSGRRRINCKRINFAFFFSSSEHAWKEKAILNEYDGEATWVSDWNVNF